MNRIKGLAGMICAAACMAQAQPLAAVGTNALALTNLSLSTNLSSLLLTMDSLDDRRVLSRGDKVNFRVLEDKEDPRVLTVSELGELEIPYLGRISATNKTCKQLAFELKNVLEKTLYYKATPLISLESTLRGLGKVHVVGHVRLPGSVELNTGDELTVSQVILKLGGFTEFANKKRVKLTRPKGAVPGEVETIYINVQEIWEKGRAEKDIKVQPGDVIFVDRRVFNL
jgi:protein involved in polysaccharide export with SLBB domain